MPQGLEVYNDSGNYLIDGSTPNIVFLTKGNATNEVTFSSPSYPIVFIRPNNGYMIYIRDNGGGSYTYFCRGDFSYWVFCNMVDPNSQNFGLQVFNESGALVYGSNTRALKIYGVTGYTRSPAPDIWSNYGGDVAAYAGLPNANFAFCPSIGSVRFKFTFDQGSATYGATNAHIESLIATSNGFVIREVKLDGTGFLATINNPTLNNLLSNEWRPAESGSILIADVSGL